jgi:hypothetical protein
MLIGVAQEVRYARNVEYKGKLMAECWVGGVLGMRILRQDLV